MGFYGDSSGGGGGDGTAIYMQTLLEMINPEAIQWALFMLDSEGMVGEVYNALLMVNDDDLAALETHAELFEDLARVEYILALPLVQQWYGRSPLIAETLLNTWQGMYSVFFKPALNLLFLHDNKTWLEVFDRAMLNEEVIVKALVKSADGNPSLFATFADLSSKTTVLRNIVFGQGWALASQSGWALEQLSNCVANCGDWELIAECWRDPVFKLRVEQASDWAKWRTDALASLPNRLPLILHFASVTGVSTYAAMASSTSVMTAIVANADARRAVFGDTEAMRAIQNSQVANDAFAAGAVQLLNTNTSGSIPNIWGDIYPDYKVYVIGLRQYRGNYAGTILSLKSSAVDNSEWSIDAGAAFNTGAVYQPVRLFMDGVQARTTNVNTSGYVQLTVVRCD